ncbi:Hvo_1808 family surface protein [Natrarchaeobius sp. A-rgal3]|uniref:Hvo_1808 family surface protein n=1 Tax=Natrarchaeobius versutus TaxID=1679078 RepID=UPI00350FADA8
MPGTAGELDTDRELGQIGPYAHDDSFAFDERDALTGAQLEAVTYRAMARIEVIRGLKFERSVEVDVIDRAEYRADRGEPTEASAFENELWRGTFLVDGETDANEAFDAIYADAVEGYYTNDRIVIVVDDPEEIRVDRRVLVHELTHALQDQQFGIATDGETIDAQRAETGLIEGEAEYVPDRYDERCGVVWQCLPDVLPAPADGEELEERPFEAGLFLSIYAPYAEGTSFVASLHETGGWEAVDRVHDEPPASTAQLIHPDRYPDDRPRDVPVTDRSSDEWEPITDDGEAKTETVGEATLFAALWANDVVDRPLEEGSGEFSAYNYSYPATEGWAGDTFAVYRAVDDPDHTGYVWALAWERDENAAAFADAYRTLLENRGAEPLEATDPAGGKADVALEDTYVIPDGEAFAGAYRVNVAGDTVEIVGAPEPTDLAEIHARVQPPTPTVGPASAKPAVAVAGPPA